MPRLPGWPRWNVRLRCSGDIEVEERYPGVGSTDIWGISFAFSDHEKAAVSEDMLERQPELFQPPHRTSHTRPCLGNGRQGSDQRRTFSRFASVIDSRICFDSSGLDRGFQRRMIGLCLIGIAHAKPGNRILELIVLAKV